MLTIQYAKAEPGIKFNALEPGTTATDMTAAFGIGRSPEQSAAFVVRLATLGPEPSRTKPENCPGEHPTLIAVRSEPAGRGPPAT
jgi:NAD(P)-dependent dehydrogenase (short-subunit alcohol dehydrogenase family)